MLDVMAYARVLTTAKSWLGTSYSKTKERGNMTINRDPKHLISFIYSPGRASRVKGYIDYYLATLAGLKKKMRR